MDETPHDDENVTSAQESQDAAARAAVSVKNDIIPAPHPVRDAIDDLIPGDRDGAGH